MLVEKFCVQGLPSVMFDNRKSLPETPCIYLVVDADDRVLYVGRSINPNQRWASHHKYSTFVTMKGIRIAYLEADESLLYSVEKALISWFKPPFNETDKHDVKGLEALRRQAGLTQVEVSKALGVDVSTVRNWEKGRDGTRMFAKVAKLCDLFQCNPWDLVEEDEDLD